MSSDKLIKDELKDKFDKEHNLENLENQVKNDINPNIQSIKTDDLNTSSHVAEEQHKTDLIFKKSKDKITDKVETEAADKAGEKDDKENDDERGNTDNEEETKDDDSRRRLKKVDKGNKINVSKEEVDDIRSLGVKNKGVMSWILNMIQRKQ